MRLVESQMVGIFGSVLLLDKDGIAPAARRRAEPARGLHQRRSTASRIGPNVGSCGTAAYRREAVMVADIHDRPLVDRLSGIGRGARASFVLVDADPVASRRRARHIRDVFEDGARADRASRRA